MKGWGLCWGIFIELCELKPHPVNLVLKFIHHGIFLRQEQKLDVNEVLDDIKILLLTGGTRARHRQPFALGHGAGKAATSFLVTPRTRMGNLVPNHLQTTCFWVRVLYGAEQLPC